MFQVAPRAAADCYFRLQIYSGVHFLSCLDAGMWFAHARRHQHEMMCHFAAVNVRGAVPMWMLTTSERMEVMFRESLMSLQHPVDAIQLSCAFLANVGIRIEDEMPHSASTGIHGSFWLRVWVGLWRLALLAEPSGEREGKAMTAVLAVAGFGPVERDVGQAVALEVEAVFAYQRYLDGVVQMTLLPWVWVQRSAAQLVAAVVVS